MQVGLLGSCEYIFWTNLDKNCWIFYFLKISVAHEHSKTDRGYEAIMTDDNAKSLCFQKSVVWFLSRQE